MPDTPEQGITTLAILVGALSEAIKQLTDVDHPLRPGLQHIIQNADIIAARYGGQAYQDNKVLADILMEEQKWST